MQAFSEFSSFFSFLSWWRILKRKSKCLATMWIRLEVDDNMLIRQDYTQLFMHIKGIKDSIPMHVIIFFLVFIYHSMKKSL